MGDPIGISEATAIACDYLAREDADLVLIEGAVEEFPCGWVFHYTSRRYLISKDFRDLLAGNAPLLVDRSSRRLISLGTAHPLDFYMTNYSETGDPHTELGRTVQLVSWRAGASRLGAIKAVRDATALGLAAAKREVGLCLGGQMPKIVAKDVETSILLVSTLNGAGFEARRLPDRNLG